MFIQTQERSQLPGSGKKESRIAIVGDYTDGFDANARKPFSGPGGTVLENCLHNAGLIRAECYFTNLFKIQTSNPMRLYGEKNNGKFYFTDEGQEYVEALREELSQVNANIFLACGPAAFAALCDLGHLSMYRGYVFESTLLPGRKVIPTFHPKQAMRGMYTYRYLIAADLRKVKEESEFPGIRRPARTLVYSYASVQEAIDWLDFHIDKAQVGFDIEVINYEVSCISFASTPDIACVIPIAGRWNLDEELQVWRGIQRVLGNPSSTKIVQNGMFDIPFLLTRNGIVIRGPIHDTMVGHSILYPELPKSLGFLGGIYCGSQEYWKDTVRFKNIKDES
jgi:uracil-DNA glycosylase family 4